MSPAHDLTNRIGDTVSTLAAGASCAAYIPKSLPPSPPLDLGPLLPLMESANQALGRLDGVASILPDTPLFLYMYVRKEALLSSQIEGTQSSLSDLLLFENDETPGVPIDDVEEVSNYVAALNKGLDLLRGGLPLSGRLIRQVHDILLRGGRGSTKAPGEYRRVQNWIGGPRPDAAIFVPPPPAEVEQLMADLERFIHEEESGLPLLVKAALVHVQFETIHSFLDGNGRLGRLLVTLMLVERGALAEPLLYLSLYLKTHRARYYALLQDVRERGEWEKWLHFLLTGVKEVSEQAADAATRIIALFAKDRAKLETLGRAAGSAALVHDYLQSRPILSVPKAAVALNLSAPTIRKSVEHLETLGIVRETSGRRRGRTYAYSAYLDILSDGTAPL